MVLLCQGGAEAAGRSFMAAMAVEEEDTIRIIEVKEVATRIFRDQNLIEISETSIRGTTNADTGRGMLMVGIKVTASHTTTTTMVVEEGTMEVMVGSSPSKGMKTQRKVRWRCSLVAIVLRINSFLRVFMHSVTSQNVGQLRGRLEGLLCIASEIMGFFRAFISKT
jgi:hypothetical protein